jgi:signal peptidase I
MTYAAPDPAVDQSNAPASSAPRRGLGCALEIVETLVLTLVIYLLIHNFIAQPFEVEQPSMTPTVLDGDYVLIDKVSPRFSDYERGDIVVFNPPAGEGDVPFIKRVIGLPGDTVELDNGRVYVTPPGGNRVRLTEPYINTEPNGKPMTTIPKDAEGTAKWTVAAGTYFVLGDNRSVSEDSRFFGAIDRSLIIGRAWVRYFPLNRIGVLNRPTYDGLPSSTQSPAPSASGAAGSVEMRPIGALRAALLAGT